MRDGQGWQEALAELQAQLTPEDKAAMDAYLAVPPAAAQPQHPEAWAHIAACAECREMGYPEPPESLAIGVTTFGGGAAVVRAGEMLRALRVYGYAKPPAAAQPRVLVEAETRRAIGLRQALRRAEKFSSAWKRLAHVLETDLRVARAGGAALAQEVHELRAAQPGERERALEDALDRSNKLAVQAALNNGKEIDALRAALRWAMGWVMAPVKRIKGQNEVYCDAYENAQSLLRAAAPTGEKPKGGDNVRK